MTSEFKAHPEGPLYGDLSAILRQCVMNDVNDIFSIEMPFALNPVFCVPYSPVDMAKRHFLSGYTALKKGDYREALEGFSKVLDLQVLKSKRALASMYLAVACLHRQMGEYREAIKAFETWLAIQAYDPDAPIVYMVKIDYACTLGLLHEYEKVVKLLQSLPTKWKQGLAVIIPLAAAFLGLNKPGLAIEVLKKGPINKRNITSERMKLFRYLVGLTYKELGEFKRASQHLLKIYVEDAEYANVKELLEELDKCQTRGRS